MLATLDHIEEVAAGIKTYWLKPAADYPYIAGQFTELTPGLPGDKHEKRWLTISSAPTEQFIAVTTKFPNNFTSEFKRTMLSLKPGATVHLADAMGDFVLPKAPNIPLVFVAIGIGITPMRSMIKYLLDTKQRRNITLLYAAATDDQLAFMDIFKSYGIKLTTFISQPRDTKTNPRKLTVQDVLAYVEDKNTLVYLSGPEPMIESFSKALTAAGIQNSQVVADYFPGYSKL